MVSPRQPQRAKATHTLVTRHHVHQGVLQGVAHVERTRDVRRRDDDGKDGSLWILIDLWREEATRLPALVVMLFGLFWVVLFRDFHLQSVLCTLFFELCSLCFA